jgi:hypothetical protein
MDPKPIIKLPLNPSNYYGNTFTLHHISEKEDQPIFYVGPSHQVQEMKVLSVKVENDVYTIETDKAILIGTGLTRINIKSDHSIIKRKF